MKTKSLSIFTAVALSVLLTACGSGTVASTEGNEPPVEKTLGVQQIVGTTWKTNDGTTYTFSKKLNKDEPDGYYGGFPNAVAKKDQTKEYALKKNGKNQRGNNGSGMWYAITNYLPDDSTNTDGTWHKSNDGELYLAISTYNRGEHYQIIPYENKMYVTYLPTEPPCDKSDPDSFCPSEDTGFKLAFEEAKDSAQLNNGVAILKRAK